MAKETFYISTAIDYPSSKPHLGHCYEKVCADVIARYKRLQGFDVFFSTGLDNHGKKMKNAAEKAGKSPEDFVQEMGSFFLALCAKYKISYDDFIRTTDERHEKVVQELFNKVNDAGEIYKGKYSGHYCVECETFYTEKELENGNCPFHKTPAKIIDEESYFFKMSEYRNKMLEHFKKNKDYLQPESRRNEILSKLKDELRDLSVSRASLDWGVRVPIDEKHTIFVWVDALINYLSVIDYPNENFKKYWPADLHVIGKDIIFHHSVIWGTWLMAAGIPLPKSIFAHGFINIKGVKMSKSAGATIDPLELVERFPADSIRYYLCREIPFGEDGDFSEESLTARHNNELANELGNLLNRTLTMIEKYSESKIPKGENDKNLESFSKKTFEAVVKAYDKYDFISALSASWKLIAEANSYINSKEPWKLAKEKKHDELNNVLYNLAELLRIVSVLVAPVLVDSSKKIRGQLSLAEAESFQEAAEYSFLKEGTKITKAGILFEKL